MLSHHGLEGKCICLTKNKFKSVINMLSIDQALYIYIKHWDIFILHIYSPGIERPFQNGGWDVGCVFWTVPLHVMSIAVVETPCHQPQTVWGGFSIYVHSRIYKSCFWTLSVCHCLHPFQKIQLSEVSPGTPIRLGVDLPHVFITFLFQEMPSEKIKVGLFFATHSAYV